MINFLPLSLIGVYIITYFTVVVLFIGLIFVVYLLYAGERNFLDLSKTGETLLYNGVVNICENPDISL